MLGYEQIERVATLAVMSGEHVLIIGRPGTGKSAFARQFFAGFEGELFAYQFSRFTAEADVFGIPSPERLMRDGVPVYPTSALPFRARFYFLDELFDASDVLLRTLLGILNERRFFRMDPPVAVSLETAIATSNALRLTEQTEAVLDRFLFTSSAPTLDDSSLLRIVQEYGGFQPSDVVASSQPKPWSAVLAVRKAAQKALIPEDVARQCVSLAREFGFSARRLARWAWTLRVRAAMNRRAKVTLEDVEETAAFVLPAVLDGRDSVAASLPERLRETRTREERRVSERKRLLSIIDKAIQPNVDQLEYLRACVQVVKELVAFGACEFEENEEQRQRSLEAATQTARRLQEELGLTI
jgi:MoxR-like ATPase